MLLLFELVSIVVMILGMVFLKWNSVLWVLVILIWLDIWESLKYD